MQPYCKSWAGGCSGAWREIQDLIGRETINGVKRAMQRGAANLARCLENRNTAVVKISTARMKTSKKKMANYTEDGHVNLCVDWLKCLIE